MRTVYYRLPTALQHVACTAYGLKEGRSRFSKRFHQRLAFLRGSEWWSREELDNYQKGRLQTVLKYAASLPFYAKYWSDSGADWRRIGQPAELSELPILEKDHVRAHYDGMLGSSRGMIVRYTSGTTGSALKFAISREAIADQWATWWRFRMRFGVAFGDTHVNFTGKPVVPWSQKEPPYWRWNWAWNQALVPMQVVRQENASALAEFYIRAGLRYVTGYPSIVAQMARILESQGMMLNDGPKVALLGAEPVYEWQTELIGRVLGLAVHDQYGFSEGAGNASQCEAGLYHEDAEFGVLECANPQRIDEQRVRGEIIATGLANTGMPFVRYRTGDVAVWREGPCLCGRQGSVLERIEGRREDYVVTPEGHEVMRFDYVFKNTPEIAAAQVVQSELGHITIRYIKGAGYGEDVLGRVLHNVREYISPSIAVDFEQVESLIGANGEKYRAVVSNLGDAQSTSWTEGAPRS